MSPALLVLAIVLGAALLSMPAYAVLHRGRPDGLLEGLSDNYLKVWFSGDAELQGRLCHVQILALAEGGLLARILRDTKDL